MREELRLISTRSVPQPRPSRVVLLVALVGLLVTAGAWWTARQLDRSNERDLLRVQTRQAADVIGSAVVAIVNPLQNSLHLAEETRGDAGALRRYLEPYTRRGATFVGVAVWRLAGGRPAPVMDVGGTLIQDADSPGGAGIAARARTHPFAVQGLFAATPQRIAYAVADRTYVVYAERAIPMNRQVPAERNSAFADLNFATYVGDRPTAAALTTTDVDPADLPLPAPTARESIPFGDTHILLVTSPATHLGGTFAARLPWISLGIGLLLTGVAALTARQLVGRRLVAETDAATIKQLYERLDGLYAQQRSVSLTLQHALLPRTNPVIDGVEFASAYVAGDQGVEIGGDWYSVIAMPGGRFGFVVGDVSGRGVDAAAIMARVRFTLRAYLLEGHDAASTLAMAARDLDVVRDGHLVTVLIGVGEPATRTLTVASAGHPPPLLATSSGTRYADVAVGPPLGVGGAARYPATTLEMPAASMLVAYTDGLVERRDEDIDSGLARLAAAVTLPAGPLPSWLAELLPAQLGDGAADDVAVLALRWSGDALDDPPDDPGDAASEAAASEPTLLD